MAGAHQWSVELRGHRYDLELVARVFGSPDCRVHERGGRYFASSTKFDMLEAGGDVLDTASTLVDQINAAMGLRHGGFQSISLGAAFDGDPLYKGATHIRLSETIKSTARLFPPTISQAGVPPPAEDDRAAQYVRLAQSDPEVAAVLRFLRDDEPSTFDIGKVIDDIIGKRTIVKKGWATEAEVSSCLGSINNDKVMGTAARHALSPQDAPRKPMDLAQARDFAKAIACKFLDWRVAGRP